MFILAISWACVCQCAEMQTRDVECDTRHYSSGSYLGKLMSEGSHLVHLLSSHRIMYFVRLHCANSIINIPVCFGQCTPNLLDMCWTMYTKPIGHVFIGQPFRHVLNNVHPTLPCSRVCVMDFIMTWQNQHHRGFTQWPNGSVGSLQKSSVYFRDSGVVQDQPLHLFLRLRIRLYGQRWSA
jgi:hypothetical protein